MNKPFYVTFNDKGSSPYPMDEYLVVYAKDITDAIEKYSEVYPSETKGHYSFACIYSGADWNASISKFYHKDGPVEVIGKEKDGPSKLYVIVGTKPDGTTYEAGYAETEHIANHLLSVLSENAKDKEYSYSVCSACMNQVTVDDTVLSFEEHEEDAGEMEL